MDAMDPQTIATWVAWGGLAIGLVFGWVAALSNFCTMGALADISNMGDWTRLRMWALAIAVAIAGAALIDVAYPGVLDASMYRATRLTWLSHCVGGTLFGFGMVLASGCGAKTLIRVGAGNLKSLVVAIVLAISADMALRGALAPLRANVLDQISIDLGGPQDLGALLGSLSGHSAALLRAVLAVALAGAFAVFALWNASSRAPIAVTGGVVTGLMVVAAWYVTGHIGYLPEHPDTLQAAWVGGNSGRPESITFVGPQAYTLDLLLLWTDRSRVLTFGIASVIGTVAGSALYAIWTGRFRLEGFRDAEDTASHLIGALLMGFGGVTALGCTVGQGIGGLSTLAMGSFITLAAIILGALAAFRYLEWRWR